LIYRHFSLIITLGGGKKVDVNLPPLEVKIMANWKPINRKIPNVKKPK